MSDSSVDTYPPFVSSMVIGEYEKPSMLENAVAFGEHGCQFVGEEYRTSILDFVFPSSRFGFGIIQKLVQPIKEKIGELGVVNIVEEWGIGYNDVYTAVWNTGTTGIAVNRVPLLDKANLLDTGTARGRLIPPTLVFFPGVT